MKRLLRRAFNGAAAVSAVLLVPCAGCLLLGVPMLYFHPGDWHPGRWPDLSPSVLFGEKLYRTQIVRDWGVVTLVHQGLPPPYPAAAHLIGVRVWVVALFLLVLPCLKYRRPLLGLPEKLRPEGLCPNCGYDLTGNVSGRCPECGTVPTPTARPSPA